MCVRSSSSWVLSLLLVAILLAGCGQQTGTESTDEPEVAALSSELRSSEEYRLWQTIVGDFKDGVFRGVAFGDIRQKVQITEAFELFEESPEQLGYTHDTQDLETVDVYYHFSEREVVDEITVDIFLNGKSSADRLWNIAGWYFTKEWGEPSESAETRKVWNSDVAIIALENVSSGIDNGLKLTFSPTDKSILADLLILGPDKSEI